MAEESEFDFDRRLERLIVDPESIRYFWTKLSRPLLRLLNVRPELHTKALLAFVNATSEGSLPLARVAQLREEARKELSQSLTSLEQAYLVYGRVAPELVNWALRLKTVLDQAERVVDLVKRSASDTVGREAAQRTLRGITHRALPALSPKAGLSERGKARVNSVDPLLEAAEHERDFLGRRRNLLEAARELLLDSAAQVTNQKDIEARLEHVAREIGELDRLEACGVQPDVALVHQLKNAWSERAAERVNAILSTLESQALRVGDARISELTNQGLARLWKGENRFLTEYRARSLARSGKETFQPEVLAALSRGLELAKKGYEKERLDKGRLKFDSYFDKVARRYLEEEPETELIQSALYVDGCVDVGGVLSPHRVFEPWKVVREVRFPTQNLTLSVARDVDDMKDAIVTDPRTFMLDFVTERLLSRRFLGEETRHVERRVMASEVRIFLLDGSGSMLGPRARMRDAILVAELSTMIARLNDKDRWLTPTLYYRYFNQELGPIVKVSTASEAIDAVEQVVSRVRHGGTDIEGALLQSFDTVREAQASAEELAQAQIVLVTDGEAPIDEGKVMKARESVGGVPIGVSIIALGEENPTLRALAAHQRDQGERVFYQFLNDKMLSGLAKGERSSLSLHLPDTFAKLPLDEALGSVIDEIAQHGKERDDEALARVKHHEQALTDVGLTVSDLSRSEQARYLALSRDHEMLSDRFLRWFPKPTTKSENAREVALALNPSDADREGTASVLGVLAAVTELTELVGSDEHRRKVDAVELFERLLMERRMSFLHYRKLLERYPGMFDAPLRALHGSVSGTPEQEPRSTAS